MEYALMDRYTIACTYCHGEGCIACRDGEIPVYVLTHGAVPRRCRKHGHLIIGHAERVEEQRFLPRVCWCRRCEWQQIQTDVPEAYPVRAS